MGIDRYGGQYNVITDTSPYFFNYRLYKEVGKTGINEFEVRAIETDIRTIWESSSSISACDRWRMINIMLEKRMDPYMTYPPIVQRSTIPWNPDSIVYWSPWEAVYYGFISTKDAHFDLAYSTVPICQEGGKLPFK